jgi:hypothetical protein
MNPSTKQEVLTLALRDYVLDTNPCERGEVFARVRWLRRSLVDLEKELRQATEHERAHIRGEIATSVSELARLERRALSIHEAEVAR